MGIECKVLLVCDLRNTGWPECAVRSAALAKAVNVVRRALSPGVKPTVGAIRALSRPVSALALLTSLTFDDPVSTVLITDRASPVQACRDITVGRSARSAIGHVAHRSSVEYERARVPAQAINNAPNLTP